jgi:hypothetical protein
MLTIIIYCIKACNNVQRENNVLQNLYSWHRHKIGISYYFVCFSCRMIGDRDSRWRRIWRTWCVKLILECYDTYAFLTIVLSKSRRHKYVYYLCCRYLYNFPERLFDICSQVCKECATRRFVLLFRNLKNGENLCFERAV